MSWEAERRTPRIDLRRLAWLTNSEGGKSEVTILDVSAGGFRMQFSDPVTVGEVVLVTFDREELVEAEIRWVLGDEAGASFVKPSAGSHAL